MSDTKKEPIAIEMPAMPAAPMEKQNKQKKPTEGFTGTTDVKLDYNNHEKLTALEAKQYQPLQNSDWQAAVTNLHIPVDTAKPLTTLNLAEATAYIVSAMQNNRPMVAQFAPLDNRLNVAGPSGSFVNPVVVAARSIVGDRNRAFSAMEIAKTAGEAGYNSIVPRF